MKRVICLILCGVLLLGLCSCQQSVAPLAWTEETQNQIKQDYAKYHNTISGSNDNTSDDVIIKHYLGIYQKNAVALCMFSTKIGYLIQVVEEDIAGFHFTFTDTDFVEIYQEGSFRPLKEAYEKGIVSKEDVQEIHNLFELGMDKELYDRVTMDYANAYNDYVRSSVPENHEFRELLSTDVYILDYYGTYQNNVMAFKIFANVIKADDFHSDVEIAGILFEKYNITEPPCVYYNGTFTLLKEAYENGIVSKDDIKEIHDKYERKIEE